MLKKPKKSQLEIHMSFSYNKSYSLNLHVININGKICNFSKFFPKKFFSLNSITRKQVFLMYLLDGYLKIKCFILSKTTMVKLILHLF